MPVDLYNHLKSKLKKKLSPERFRHSVAVGDLASLLGEKHGWSPARARLAGLLHDYAKEWSPKKMLAYVRKHKLAIPGLDFMVANAPNMMHAYIGADVARRKGWLTKKNDWRAIESHTLGRKKMTMEEKILYVADFAAEGRSYPAAADVRSKAVSDLAGAFRDAMSYKLFWQLKKAKPIHPYPVKVWNRVVCNVKRH